MAKSEVPVWTLATDSVAAPIPIGQRTLSEERLSELRGALTAFAESPIVTLEAHPLLRRRSPSDGLRLDSMSPLATELSRLIARTPKDAPAMEAVADSGEVLYRMVVPAKVAADVGKGLVKPMAAKTLPNAFYGDLVGKSNKIAAKASFVPVTATSAGTGATAGAAGATAGTVTVAAGLTIAAPLVLMAVAVGASARADQQRQRAIENITGLLEKLHDDKLEDEQGALESCRDAINKATALLLDQGRVGASLGLDSAVHAINSAMHKANSRLKKWHFALDKFGDDRVEITQLEGAFPGIGSDGGEFRAHLELAALAIALKRRVIVLQGVEAGQSDPGNPYKNFVLTLRADQEGVDELEERLTHLMARLSSLHLRPPSRFTDRLMSRGHVDELLESSYRLRDFGRAVATQGAGDVVIEIERHEDGRLLVMPAQAV